MERSKSELKVARLVSYLASYQSKMMDSDNRKLDESSFGGDTTDSGVNLFQNVSDCSSPRNSTGNSPVMQISGTIVDPPFRPYRRSECSLRNVAPISLDSLNTVPEMTRAEKRSRLKRNLTVMFSCIYAVILIVLGGIIYISYQQPQTRHVSDIFSSCIALIGMGWLMFFHIDLFCYKRRVLKMMMEGGEDPCDRGSISMDINLPPWEPDTGQDPPYRFLTGRHSGSFYLKTGLAGFCFGHLISEGLAFGQEILNYVQEDRFSMRCGEVSAVMVHCIRPIYSFYQLFIVFKYANIVINQYKELARFALMHIMATCLCFWFSAIVQDALEDYHHKLDEISYKNVTPQFTVGCKNIDGKNTSVCGCASNAILSGNNLQAIPYLYPFTVEFNLLLAGVWFIVWHNIGKHHRANPHHFRHKINNDDGIEEITFQSNLVISADCHASNKGLFAGLFLLMTSVISVIVFFVAMSNAPYVALGVSIHTTQEAVLSLASLGGVIIAYRQLSKLDFNLHPITFLDDVLMFVPLPFFFVHCILSINAEARYDNWMRIALTMLTTVQVVLQTPLISDGLRRCSNSHVLRYEKPGREIVTFLIVCNLTLWIINTFEAKSVEPHHAQHRYYGELLWMFVGHTTLPLMLFYRFHASVCLADIWKSAYVRSE